MINRGVNNEFTSCCFSRCVSGTAWRLIMTMPNYQTWSRVTICTTEGARDKVPLFQGRDSHCNVASTITSYVQDCFETCRANQTLPARKQSHHRFWCIDSSSYLLSSIQQLRLCWTRIRVVAFSVAFCEVYYYVCAAVPCVPDRLWNYYLLQLLIFPTHIFILPLNFLWCP